MTYSLLSLAQVGGGALPSASPDALLPIALAALGALTVICLGVVITILQNISRTLTTQGESQAVLHAILCGIEGSPGLVDRVQSLHDWRNDLQRRELQQATAEIIELKRRAGDRP
jgi:hypothetical protein